MLTRQLDGGGPEPTEDRRRWALGSFRFQDIAHRLKKPGEPPVTRENLTFWALRGVLLDPTADLLPQLLQHPEYGPGQRGAAVGDPDISLLRRAVVQRTGGTTTAHGERALRLLCDGGDGLFRTLARLMGEALWPATQSRREPDGT